MFGAFTVRATRSEDIPELSEFLRRGFREPGDPPHFRHVVMHWKYFEPCGVDFGPRSYLAIAGNAIVGHVGIVPRLLHVPQENAAPALVRSLHFIDLLASPSHATAGFTLMKQGFKATDVQYALGGSADGQRIALATGYACRFEYPVMRTILRPLFRLRESDGGPMKKLLRAVKDSRDYALQSRSRPQRSVSLKRVAAFDDAVDVLLARYPQSITRTARSAALLNAYFSAPTGAFSGWMLHCGDELVGWAMLNVKTEGAVHYGKIVECCVPSLQQDLLQGAIESLKQELRRQGADVVSCYASSPRMEEACRLAGFKPLPRKGKFYLRDPRGCIPANTEIHLSMLEGDHAYF